MKKILFTICLLQALTVSNAQTVDEVLDKYILAMGGAERLAGIQSIKMSGSLTASGMQIDVETTVLHGKGYRLDISVPGMDPAFQVYTPTKGWRFLPFQGQTSVTELSEAEVKPLSPYLDAQGILFNYKEKGYKAVLEGTEIVNGETCYRIKLENAAGFNSTYFIDNKNYYKIKALVPSQTGAMTEVFYSDFRKNEAGYLVAYSQTNTSGTIEFSTVEFNKPVDESVFKVN